MSQSTVLQLLPQTVYINDGTNNPYTVTGNTVQAASYYLGSQDLQTLSLNFSGVTGNLVVEASLANPPTADSDWFQVYRLSANNQANVNSNTSSYQNLTGNFVNMRAKIEDFAHGTVQYVKISY
jgi:hypothetical protein|tara:strand:+ start:619 stop:990 length:372 start_codon:yes stop_codon:yes gene_type:complete